uniref:SJCHGC03044 protein n=1 Tax=Schistosoma japonicum TaxID=6182 RepID=Q5BSZ1_SCHJA|nr:SJCHGC03044 protein [Schistosoma japonicum]
MVRHVMRMPDCRLPRFSMLARVELGWNKGRRGQIKTWHQSIKYLTADLSHVGRCRLPG